MHTKQTIAIIGATENLGIAMSKNLAKGNYRLLLKGDSTEALEILIKKIKNNFPAADVEMEPCTTEAGWEADIIILAVPKTSLKEVAAKIKEVANQKIVISFEENLHENITSPQITLATNDDDALEQLLPNSKLIKVNVESLLKAHLESHDDAALEVVSDILMDAGFQLMVNT